MKISFTTTQEVDITPKQLAEVFCEMDSDQQAEVLNHIATIFHSWDNEWFQIREIMSSDKLYSGKAWIKSMYEEIKK